MLDLDSSSNISSSTYQLCPCLFLANDKMQTDGLVWVVDSADRWRLEDCRKELYDLLGQEVRFFTTTLTTNTSTSSTSNISISGCLCYSPL